MERYTLQNCNIKLISERKKLFVFVVSSLFENREIIKNKIKCIYY